MEVKDEETYMKGPPMSLFPFVVKIRVEVSLTLHQTRFLITKYGIRLQVEGDWTPGAFLGRI